MLLKVNIIINDPPIHRGQFGVWCSEDDDDSHWVLLRQFGHLKDAYAYANDVISLFVEEEEESPVEKEEGNVSYLKDMRGEESPK
jgi:hypothetical protein